MAPTDSPEDEQIALEQTIERSESFQTIVKRHQELSTAQPPTGPSASPPMKRPGILKKPKDWSSPSPQEIPSPIKEDSAVSSSNVISSNVTSSNVTSSNVTSSSAMSSLSSSRKTSHEQTTSTNRKASIESSIEIQLNPIQSSSIVVTEIPASGLDRRNSRLTNANVNNVNYSTVQYNSVQDVEMTGTGSSSGAGTSGGPGGVGWGGDHRRGSQLPRKLSVDVEPSPMMHTSSVTLPTTASTSGHAVGSSFASASASTSTSTSTSGSGMVLSGQSSGHSVRSTSNFQLSNSTTRNSISTAATNVPASVVPISIRSSLPESNGDDPTPWRRKSIPREPSNPPDDPPAIGQVASALVAHPPAPMASTYHVPASAATPSRVSAARSTIESSSSPIPSRSSRIVSSTLTPSSVNESIGSSTSTTSTTNTTSATATSTATFQRSSVDHHQQQQHQQQPQQPQQPQQQHQQTTSVNRLPAGQVENSPFGGSANNKTTSEPLVPRVKTLAATGASVRALAQKFITTGEEKSQPQVVRLD